LPRACRKSLAIARSGEPDGASCRLSPRCCRRSRILCLDALHPRNTVHVLPISVHERALSGSVLCYTAPKHAGKRGWGVAQNTARKNSRALVPGRTMFQGITQVSVPVLSPSGEMLLVLTAVGPLSRAMQSAAVRLSESVRLLRLG